MSYGCINLEASKFQKHQVTGVEMAPSTDILALCLTSHPMWVSLPSGEAQDRGTALTKKKEIPSSSSCTKIPQLLAGRAYSKIRW